MTNEEILKKAIEKAVKNGFDDFDGQGSYLDKDNLSGVIVAMWKVNELIFSHRFAKAFWGEAEKLTERREGIGNICLHCGEDTSIANPPGFCSHIQYPDDCEICKSKKENWQYHLQQMVLEENPIKYLEKFI